MAIDLQIPLLKGKHFFLRYLPHLPAPHGCLQDSAEAQIELGAHMWTNNTALLWDSASDIKAAWLHVGQGLSFPLADGDLVNTVNGMWRTTPWTKHRCLLQGEISSSLEITDCTNLIPIDNRGSLDTSITYK